MSFNLADWALRHRPLIGFSVVLLFVAGLYALRVIHQREDPDFAFRVMVVRTAYLGATAREVADQVTDVLEKKLQDMPPLDLYKLLPQMTAKAVAKTGLLFLPAGTLDWWRAWVFLGVVFVGTVASTVSVFRFNKALLEERFKPPAQKGQPLADKIVVVLLIGAFVILIVFIPRGESPLQADPVSLVGQQEFPRNRKGVGWLTKRCTRKLTRSACCSSRGTC